MKMNALFLSTGSTDYSGSEFAGSSNEKINLTFFEEKSNDYGQFRQPL